MRVLQAKASISVADIGERIGLSSTPCWQRIQRLERDRVITRTVALVDQDKIGIKVTGYILIQTRDHSYAWLKQFSKSIRDIAEVIEVYRMAGDVDYMLRIAAADQDTFDAVLMRLRDLPGISKIEPRLIDATIKFKTALPIASLRSSAPVTSRASEQ